MINDFDKKNNISHQLNIYRDLIIIVIRVIRTEIKRLCNRYVKWQNSSAHQETQLIEGRAETEELR